MMKHIRIVTFVAVVSLTAIVVAQSNTATDWPQWLGPDRTGVSKEVGLLKQWPTSGPPLTWSASGVGAGYGSLAIKGDRIFVQGSGGGRSVVFSLNRAEGRMSGPRRSDRPAATIGARAAGHATVDGDRLYVLTENGDLACLKTQDGSVVWQRNILQGLQRTQYRLADQ